MSDYADKKWAKAVLKNAGTAKTKIASVDDKEGQPYASVPENPTDSDIVEAKGILGMAIDKNKGGYVKKYAHGGSVRKTKMSDY
jgi:hypothetical protein